MRRGLLYLLPESRFSGSRSSPGIVDPVFNTARMSSSIATTLSFPEPRRHRHCTPGELAHLTDPFSPSIPCRSIDSVIVTVVLVVRRRAIAACSISGDLEVAALPVYGSQMSTASNAPILAS